jgi:hypothetical protein
MKSLKLLKMLDTLKFLGCCSIPSICVAAFVLSLPFVAGCAPQPNPAPGANGQAQSTPNEPAPREIWELTWHTPQGIVTLEVASASLGSNYVYFTELETGKHGYLVARDVLVRQKTVN